MPRRRTQTPQLLMALGLAVFPFFAGDYWLHTGILCLFYIMMASSWNLLAGYTGQVSFAHAAFAGVGAYVSGLAAIHFHLPPLLGALLGMAVAAFLGLLLGVLCIRMGGIYLSLTTLAFSEMLRIIIDNEYEFTRGTMGLSVPFILPVYSKTAAYFLMGAVTVAVLCVIRSIVRSDLGTAFRAVQNDETAAASLGIHVVKVRLVAFVISSTMAGLAGALYGHYHQLITPEILSLNLMFFVLAITVIGGMGTFVGPIVGAIFLEFLSEYIRIYGQFHVLLFGLIALAVCRFAPQGLMGLWQRRMRALSS